MGAKRWHLSLTFLGYIEHHHPNTALPFFVVHHRKPEDKFYFEASTPSLVASVAFCPGQRPPVDFRLVRLSSGDAQPSAHRSYHEHLKGNSPFLECNMESLFILPCLPNLALFTKRIWTWPREARRY